MAAKPLSLADRIRAKRKGNRPESEVKAEKELVKTIKAVDSEPIQETQPEKIEQPTDQVVNRSSDQVHNRSTDQPLDHLTNQLTDQLTNQAVNRSSDQADKRSTDQVVNRSSDQAHSETGEQKPQNLTERQYAVLKFIYFNRPFKVHGANGMGTILGIGAPNIRNQLKSLVNKGFIYRPYSINDGVNVGSTCRVVEKKCKPLFGNTNVINPPKQKDDPHPLATWSTDQVINRSSDQVVNRSTGQVHNWSTDQVVNRSSDQVINSYNSSSSLLKETTTMQNCESDVERIISQIMTTDAEYQYWNEQQVGPKQVAAWKKEFGIDLQTILNNLCYIRWQIKNQATKINKSPADYLYGIMTKNGGKVNKPSGYKSMAQLDLEFYENWKNQHQEQQQKLEKMKADAVEAEIKPQVEAILQNLSFENEDLQTAIDKIATAKRKQVIKTSVKNAVKNGKPLGEKENSTLKFYLEMVLKEKAFKKLTLENNPGVGNANFLGSTESSTDFLEDTHRT